jgi:hypothetical protein
MPWAVRPDPLAFGACPNGLILEDVMKTYLIGLLSGIALLASYSAFSGRDGLDLLQQQQRYEAKKHAAQGDEIAQWRACWLEHSHLMRKR